MHDLNYCMPDLNYCMPDLNYCGITAELLRNYCGITAELLSNRLNYCMPEKIHRGRAYSASIKRMKQRAPHDRSRRAI